MLRNLNVNFLSYLAHGVLSQIGFRLVNVPTFIPAYLLILSGGSNFVVGLALFFQGLGQAVTPIWGANVISYRKRVVPIAIAIGFIMRTNILFIGLAGLYFSNQLTLVLVILFLGLFGLAEGMQGVVFNYLTSKILPLRLRGRLMGLRNFFGGLSASIFALFVGDYLVGNQDKLEGYSYSFIIAFFISIFGLISLILIREPAPPEIGKKQSFPEQLKAISVFLRKDPNFRFFFWARTVATMGKMTLPFYVLYAGQEVGFSGYFLGVLTSVFTLSHTFSNLLWGAMADLRGFRLVFLSSIIFWILSTSVYFFSVSFAASIVVFSVVGASISGFENSSRAIVLEFGTLKERPNLIATTNTAAQMAGALGPLLGGLIASWLGYKAVFFLGICFLFAAALMVIIFVPEPRKRFNDLETRVR
ncbi:MAG: hypothetical protein CBD40_05395 [Gammaproteobacteria bacterium TMED180]|nr:MAG: hypothetical protein CBD40_05395 [Gammaproteobacteria bacterium TMED180]